MTSAICEEFHCTPDEAERQDIALCKRIMALRRYRDSWAEVESGVPQEKLTKSTMLETVLKVQIGRVKGEL